MKPVDVKSSTYIGSYVIRDLLNEEIVGAFYKKQLPETNPSVFRVEKVMKRKGDKPYVKWKCYDSSFNTWID